ncbi:unnamed protein product, partial [marine sediment metagenome]
MDTRHLTKAQFQHLLDQGILTGTQYTAAASGTTYTEGNQYQDYESQVKALSDKYNNIARWGCLFIQSIVKVRTAFAVGTGIAPVLADERATREMAYIKEFIKLNKLDKAVPQQWGREAEIEGKVLAILIPDEKLGELGQVKARFVPWTDYSYVITADPKD